jgi:ERCC4-type nuclease
MEIVIDYRERSIIQELGDSIYTVENLIIGDIVIKKDKKELVIIERKTMDDFIGSIKSGRYAEQRERLKLFRQGMPEVKIIYLLENRKPSEIRNTIDGAITNLLLFHNISVIYSDDIPNTVDIIKNMSRKLEEKDVSSLVDCLNLPVLKKAKIHENMFMLQLCLIPGVSRTISSMIVDKYQTLHEFLECKPTAIELSGLVISKRKVGLKVAERILAVYFG